MSDKNELHTATVDVIVPFEFCKHCNRLELEDYPRYLWANGEPIAHEYSCKHGYFCRNIIELYEKSGDAEEVVLHKILEKGMIEIPSADAVQGEWIEKNGHTYICSDCGFEQAIYGNINEYNYCPRCGARMK